MLMKCALLACVAVSAPVVARSPRPIAEDAAAFGAREGATGVNLSPNGRYVAYVAPAPNGGAVAFTSDLSTGETKGFLRSGKGAEQLYWCSFVTDDRLICRYGTTLRENELLVGYSRLIAVNRDGSNLKQLGQAPSFYDAGRRQFDGQIIDWLPGGGGSVLMARSHVPEINRTGTRLGKKKEGLGVDRIDTATLRSTTVEAARDGVGGYLTDGRGNVRLMSLTEADGDGHLTGRSKYLYRTAISREWRPLTEYVTSDEFDALTVDGTTDHLYVLKSLNGRKALYRVRLGDSLTSELVASHPRVDIDQVVRSANGQHVIGYSFSEDKREVIYFDRTYDALASALGQAIPDLPMIDFVNTNEDGTKVLIYAGSDNDPGRYFVFDKTAKRLNEIMLARPELENRTLARVTPVTIASPDGVAIPAYLTLPPGKDPTGLAAVVLPHGGPSSRDEWGFDWVAQFLAARGYAVLQPNFRGSAGFGDEWLMDNGFKSWRTSIGDITASARWLSKEGVADPQRIAVVGWSYGGYAALMSAITDPSLFQAVVAIAPVTDLSMLKKEAEGYTNADLVAAFVGSGSHIEQASPLRHASQIKVPVLLAHGDLDQNVGIQQSTKMASALRDAGSKVELLEFKDLDHQLEDAAARTQMLTRMGELLQRTIGE